MLTVVFLILSWCGGFAVNTPRNRAFFTLLPPFTDFAETLCGSGI
jgi:hypothetical protein